MIKMKAPTESPEAKAARLAEEARADKANLEAEQNVLTRLTRQRISRFGMPNSGSQGTGIGNLFFSTLLGNLAGSATSPSSSSSTPSSVASRVSQLFEGYL